MIIFLTAACKKYLQKQGGKENSARYINYVIHRKAYHFTNLGSFVNILFTLKFSQETKSGSFRSMPKRIYPVYIAFINVLFPSILRLCFHIRRVFCL